MFTSLSSRIGFFGIMLGSALLMLTACGGGGGSSAESDEGPSRLYPSKVLTGTAVMGASSMTLTINLSYNSSDVSQGCYYDGDFGSAAANDKTGDDAENDDSNKTYFHDTNLRQTNETTPGRLVFYFDENGRNNSLVGRLVLTIPAESVFDEEHKRTGVVESSTELYYTTDSGIRKRLLINGAPLQVSW